MDFLVRQAGVADAPAIVELWNGFVRDTAVTFTTLEKTCDGIAADIDARGAGFLVAVSGDTLLGFATYSAFRGGPGYARTKEHSVMLAEGARGRGVGRALMEALCDAARAEGVHSLFAGVSGENPDAVAFHTAIGFQEMVRLPEVGFKFGRWMDLVLMQKFL
ncbi:GNAT family N-acetyltransferase [Donghicola mangrovi]|uniref:GNAT family N-acetyltransferase n=1 Tax=Donghicola mangrovi TaxID=2729614 RepID=UPI0015A155CB|nr:GNAT family N-acetyltransferase [Donghicola mangrovi]